MPPLSVHSLRPSPLLGTLTDYLQLTENLATLSPFPAILTTRVKVKPFVCHSYKKHPGVGVLRKCSGLSNAAPQACVLLDAMEFVGRKLFLQEKAPKREDPNRVSFGSKKNLNGEESKRRRICTEEAPNWKGEKVKS